jgi:hypothetical protein
LPLSAPAAWILWGKAPVDPHPLCLAAPVPQQDGKLGLGAPYVVLKVARCGGANAASDPPAGRQGFRQRREGEANPRQDPPGNLPRGVRKNAPEPVEPRRGALRQINRDACGNPFREGDLFPVGADQQGSEDTPALPVVRGGDVNRYPSGVGPQNGRVRQKEGSQVPEEEPFVGCSLVVARRPVHVERGEDDPALSVGVGDHAGLVVLRPGEPHLALQGVVQEVAVHVEIGGGGVHGTECPGA